jgi:hypothetical protein
MIKMDEEIKKKNILDLCFQKYLIVSSTSLIIMFTYLVGIGIALLTGQIKLDDFFVMGILFVISAVVFGIGSVFLFKDIFHIKNILRVLKEI